MKMTVDREKQSSSRWSPDPGAKKSFIKEILMAAGLLWFAIWFNAIWFWGSTYDQMSKGKYLPILVVDWDHQELGSALTSVCDELSGTWETNGFVNAENPNSLTYEQVKHKVFKGEYWGAIIATHNATAKIGADLLQNKTSEAQSTTQFASSFSGEIGATNSTPALIGIWNEIRWATIGNSFTRVTLLTAVAATKHAFLQEYGTKNGLLNGTLSQGRLDYYLDSISYEVVNLFKFEIGIRPLVNTAGVVFPAVVEFFFAMGYVHAARGTYHSGSVKTAYLTRLAVSLGFTCVVGISWGLWFEALRETINISGGQFCLIWLSMWLYAFISWEVLDTVTTFVPQTVIPPTVLTWVIINVTATVFPVQVSPRFYRLNYALPSYNFFEIFITILSHGSTNVVYRNLPVMFAWLIVFMPIGFLGTRHRVHYFRRSHAMTIIEQTLSAGTFPEKQALMDNIAHEADLERKTGQIAGVPSVAGRDSVPATSQRTLVPRDDSEV